MSSLNTNQSSDLNAIEKLVTSENNDDKYKDQKSIRVHKSKFKLLFLCLTICCLLAIIFASALTLYICKKIKLENVQQQQMVNHNHESYNLETNDEEYLVKQQ